MKGNIYLTGFSGTGKTTVGREVAARLGWDYTDVDDEIVALSGRNIHDIFREDGEVKFRDIEHDALMSVTKVTGHVVATGGGVVVDERNRDLMNATGVIVCLEARADTIFQRISTPTQEAGVVRPMLQGGNPLQQIIDLKATRQVAYAHADWTIQTDTLNHAEVADEVIHAWTHLAKSPNDANDEPDLAATVRTSSTSYPVFTNWGGLTHFGERVKNTLGRQPRSAYIITDTNVYPHARTVQNSLEAAGIPSHVFFIESGESHKTLETVQHIYQWLASQKAERDHAVIAVGGGVVGDVAGFVAGTYLRGLPLVQVPTTLVSMMDAGIGGKTGVDLPEGKNLVGLFKQPEFVLADVSTLSSLPERERNSGWAEAIKHGFILDEALLTTFETEQQAISALNPEITADVIRRSMRIKAEVVSKDEKETLGVRILLNYGHTIGHAIEAVTNYRDFLHGEAVAIGMMGAAYISNEMNMISDQDVERHRSLLSSYKLSTSYPGIDIDAVRQAMLMDKKVVGGKIRWVLLNSIGNAAVVPTVSSQIVDRALRRLAE
jgi:3-dehydroquinate synthase/shikimate kinase/3-dehydroquinate synthase